MSAKGFDAPRGQGFARILEALAAMAKSTASQAAALGERQPSCGVLVISTSKTFLKQHRWKRETTQDFGSKQICWSSSKSWKTREDFSGHPQKPWKGFPADLVESWLLQVRSRQALLQTLLRQTEDRFGQFLAASCGGWPDGQGMARGWLWHVLETVQKEDRSSPHIFWYPLSAL